MAHAFAAQTGQLDAAVRHVVDAEAGNVADDHATDLKAIPGLHGVGKLAGEHARLQAEIAVVGAGQRIVEILE